MPGRESLGAVEGRDGASMKVSIRRLWWLLSDRTIESDTPKDSPWKGRVLTDRLGFRDAWALVNPHPLWKVAVDMPCGCARMPWRRRPFVIGLDCEDHGIRTWR